MFKAYKGRGIQLIRGSAIIVRSHVSGGDGDSILVVIVALVLMIKVVYDIAAGDDGG